MNSLVTTRWGGRALCAALVFALVVATSGFVQAITGAGTPCDTCSARCYEYHGAECWKSANPMSCFQAACANWCDGCVVMNGSNTIDCGGPNCWESGVSVNGGNVCSNACWNMLCYDSPWYATGKTDKHCGQVQQECNFKGSTVACSKCDCPPQ